MENERLRGNARCREGTVWCALGDSARRYLRRDITCRENVKAIGPQPDGCFSVLLAACFIVGAFSRILAVGAHHCIVDSEGIGR